MESGPRRYCEFGFGPGGMGGWSAGAAAVCCPATCCAGACCPAAGCGAGTCAIAIAAAPAIARIRMDAMVLIIVLTVLLAVSLRPAHAAGDVVRRDYSVRRALCPDRFAPL